MSITGLPGQGPVRVGIPIADLCAGLSCAQGILVALLEREVSGKGQWLHTSLLQAQIFMLDFQAARWLVEHEVPKQAGNNHPTSIPTGVFPTRDGYINIAVTGQKIWERFCKAIDASDLIKRPEYAGSKDRSKNRDALNREIAERTKLKDSKAWVEAFNAAGVPSGPIYSIDQVFADPQVQELPMTGKVHSPKLGDLTLVAQPVVLTRTPSSLQAPPPECGEHTDEILAEYGYGRAEIEKLRQARIV
jgi:crotonobetainyl-CoA:carnitine CoA-transferase CaiB-like acyl-CoA transferase